MKQLQRIPDYHDRRIAWARGNPAFAEKYDLGVISKDPQDIKATMDDLLENDAEKLNEIIESQKKFINPKAAEDIVHFMLEVENSYNENKTALSL